MKAASTILPVASSAISKVAPVAGNIAKGIGKIFGGDIEKGVNSFVDKGMNIVNSGTGLMNGISGLFSGGDIGQNVNSIIKNGGGLISGIGGLFGGSGQAQGSVSQAVQKRPMQTARRVV